MIKNKIKKKHSSIRLPIQQMNKLLINRRYIFCIRYTHAKCLNEGPEFWSIF